MRQKPRIIIETYRETGSVSRTAELCGISRMTLKRRSRTDNGLEFRKRFRARTEAPGLEHRYIHKSSPNENAVIGRSFRTDEEEFICRRAPFSDYDNLRRKYGGWLDWYNTGRPHLGIGLKTPMEMIQSVTNVSND